MTAEVRLRPEAERDLEEAAAWYERQQPLLGHHFLDEAAATFALIAERPRLFETVHRGTHRALMRRFPFGVFYLVEDGGAIVVAILHATRDPQLWQSRV